MSALIVRPVKITDLPALRRARKRHVSLGPAGPDFFPASDLLAAVPFGRNLARAYAAISDGAIQAVVEIRPEPADFRWVVAGLGMAGDDPEQAPEPCIDVWVELLRQAIRGAGQAGAKRLHAVAPVGSPAFAALYKAGFSVYGYQTLMLARGLHPTDVQNVAVRPQHPSDLWSIHHLYHVTTPRAVQYAEAFNSSHWGLRRGATGRQQGFLLEREQELWGYCQFRSRGRRMAMTVMTQDGSAELFSSFVQQSARLAGVGGGDEVWVAIPDYHQHYCGRLEAIGFQSVGRQVTMVRYTAVPVGAEVDRKVAKVADVSERLPARVPSYYVACERWSGSNIRSAVLGVKRI